MNQRSPARHPFRRLHISSASVRTPCAGTGCIWGRSTGTPHRMMQQDAYRMIERHAKGAGIKTKIGNHTLCATGITDY